MEKRLSMPDGLRVLAIGLVMAFHIWQQSWLSPVIHLGGLRLDLSPLVRTGYLGVDAMLLLSGYLLALPQARGKQLRPVAFYRKRLIRILPCYLLCVGMYFFASALPRGEYASAGAMWKDLLTHLTFTHAFFYDTYVATHLNVVLWTLAIEMQFYLIYPLVIRCFQKNCLLTYAAMVLSALLFRRYAAQLPLEEILTGGASPEAGALRELPFDGRLSVVEFLLHSLQTKSAAMQQDADLAFSASSFAGSIPPGADALARAQELLRKRRAALAVRKDCGVLPPEEERREAAFLSRAEAALAPARTDAEASAALQKLAADAAASAQTSREAACRACENGLRFVQGTFGEDQELWILLHGLQHTRAAEALQKDPTTLCARLLTQATPAAQAATLRTELQRQ